MLAKQVFCKLKRHKTQFCPVALQVSISHHGYNSEVIFPIFFSHHKKGAPLSVQILT